MRRKLWLLFFVLVLLIPLTVGCRQAANEIREEQQQTEEQQQEDHTQAIREEWSKSAHAVATNAQEENSPAKRDECMRCHNGQAYVKQVTSADELNVDEPVGQDCDTCHSGHGKEVWASGLVTLPAGEVRDGGGALCMDCHNARKTPDPENRPAPHSSAEADIVIGTNGYHVEGVTYSSSPHTAVKDTCFGCHMADLGGGYPSHTFKADVKPCQSCHQGISDINMKAKADYDGDGSIEGFQEEVDGLLKLLHDTIEAELDGGTFSTGHGQIVFTGKDGNEMSEVSPDLYHAAWNYYLVMNDGSRGIHNPVYVVQLLQQSVLMLGGDLKDAKQL